MATSIRRGARRRYSNGHDTRRVRRRKRNPNAHTWGYGVKSFQATPSEIEQRIADARARGKHRNHQQQGVGEKTGVGRQQ